MLDRAQRAWTVSKLAWVVVLILQVLSTLLAAWAAWAPPEHAAAIAMPIAGAIAVGLTFLVRRKAARSYLRGEAWRRAFLLSESLGHEPSRAEFLRLLLDAAEDGPNLQRDPVGDYYGSRLPDGYPRLVENLAESAFYTTRQARVVATLCIVGVVVALAALAAVILGVLAAPALDASPGTWLNEAGPRLAAVASIILAFFASGQMIELAVTYLELAGSTRAVLERSIEPSSAELSPGAVLSLVGTYDTALAAASVPIPDFVSRLMKNKLHREWAELAERKTALAS